MMYTYTEKLQAKWDGWMDTLQTGDVWVLFGSCSGGNLYTYIVSYIDRECISDISLKILRHRLVHVYIH